MTAPPISPEEFDYRDKAQLAVMLPWAGCDRVLAEFAGVSESCISKWRRKYRLLPSQESYRDRSGTEPVTEPQSDSAAALLEYLQSRTVPDAPGPTAAAAPGEYATCLVGSDPHYPFVHEGAWEVFLGLADRIKPTEIVLDGDVFDFAQIGRYVKDPHAHAPFQTDIDQCRERVLARIEAASPSSVRRFIVGNHEEGRWKTYLFTHAPDIASLRSLTMEAVLGLTEMGWVWQPYEYWVTDELIIYHGDRHTNALGGGSAMSARKEAIDMGCSGVTGHTHHAGAFFRQDRTGYRVWYEIGCLCDWRAMQAANVTTRRTPTKAEDWHLACALIRYRPGHSAFRVELIPIIDDGARTFAIWQDEEIVA